MLLGGLKRRTFLQDKHIAIRMSKIFETTGPTILMGKMFEMGPITLMGKMFEMRSIIPMVRCLA